MADPRAGQSDEESESDAGHRSRVHHARTVSVLAVAEIVGKVASFVMFAVAARMLGIDDFGQFSWSFSLALPISAFVVWGFDTALIQLASGARDRLDGLLSNVLAIRALLVPVAMLVVWVFPSGSNENDLVSEVLTVAVLADSANQGIRAAAGVIDRQQAVAINLVIQRIATAVLAIGVLMAGGGLAGMSWAYLAGTMVGVCLMFVTGRRIGLRPSVRLVSISGMKELVHASHALGITTTINMLAFRVDTLLLGWLVGNEAVGAYSAAFKLFETALFVVWSLDRVAFPRMAASEGSEPIRRILHGATSVMFAIFVPYIVLMVVRGGDILNLIFGAPYGEVSVSALQVLSISLIPYALQYLLASGLLARRRNVLVTVSAVVALIVNIVANLIMIPMWGAVGAAAATLVAMAAQSIVLWIVLFRMVGSPRIIRSSLVALIAGIVMVPILLAPLNVIIIAALACAAYGAVWFVVAGWLDPTARRTLLGMLGR